MIVQRILAVNEEDIISAKSKQFISQYYAIQGASLLKSKKDNKSSVQAAKLYERVRSMVEYQEDHLMFKGAISRISRRYITLFPKIKSSDLANYICTELIWADYIGAKSISSELQTKIANIIEKYLLMFKVARSGHRNRMELQNSLVNLMACEIEELIIPRPQDDTLVDFVYDIVNPGFDLRGAIIEEKDHELQLKLAIYGQLFKPDIWSVKYRILKMIHQNWNTITIDEVKTLARGIDPFLNALERPLHQRLKNRYLMGCRKVIAPFLVMNSALSSDLLIGDVADNPDNAVKNVLMDTYKSLKKNFHITVWRGIWRALIFIFITKMLLAFVVEIPVDHLLYGEIFYTALAINLSLPPLLMFLAGLSIRPIKPGNDTAMDNVLDSILNQNIIEDFKFRVKAGKPSSFFKVLSYFYSIFSLFVLGLVIYSLVLIHFNFVSIILFFLFVSAVAFFSFRIRSSARTLEIEKESEGTITSLVELIFLPFVRLGRILSAQFARYNPFFFMLDFLIEAPLKTIIRFLRNLVKFIAFKKEELES